MLNIIIDGTKHIEKRDDMKTLKTVEGAKKEIRELQRYVFLVENYKATTLEEKIIKEYAHLGSIAKVAASINQELAFGAIDSTYVSNVIKSKPKDDLHKLIKTYYLIKTRPARRKY